MNNYKQGMNARKNYGGSVRPDDVVYAVRRLSDGAIKIGTTGALKKRIKGLQREYGEVKLLATTPGYMRREREIHKELEQYRICHEYMMRGHRKIKYSKPKPTEFFRPEPGLMAWIEANMTPYVEEPPKPRKQPVKFNPALLQLERKAA